MRFIVDAQLPPALAAWIRGRGHEADHVFDLGMGKADDAAIAGWAVSSQAVVVTKDDDFRTCRARSTRQGKLRNSLDSESATPRIRRAARGHRAALWDEICTQLAGAARIVEIR